MQIEVQKTKIHGFSNTYTYVRYKSYQKLGRSYKYTTPRCNYCSIGVR